MKNTIFLALTALLTTLLLSACWKSAAPDRSHIGGRILEYGTDAPIKGAKVNISGWSGSVGGGGSGGGNTQVATTFSNSDGYYSFDKLAGNQVLLVNATKEGYFTDLDSEVSVLDDGNYDDVDVRLKPYTWLKVTIRNESGAYGFGSSQLLAERLIQSQGQEHSVIKLIKGNDSYTLIFFILIDANTSTNNTSNIKVLDNYGNEVPIDIGASLSILTNPVGHDTTNIFISY